MAFERIELNICPAGDMPVFHCSQYDVGRPIIIDLKNGDDAFTPTAGTTFELHCRKVDDNIVTLDTYEVDGNTLTFTSTEQLCACPGDNLCEVAIYLDELCMGTLNFMLHVEPDPLAGGLESDTQIYNLTEQVREITEQVIGDDYYNKTEVDDLLDTKADAATTYTKTEVDTALNLKADKSTTYTKTETNNLLAGKADANDTYTKAQVDSKLSLKADKATTYTKTETDTLLGYKANASQVYTMSQTDLLLNDKADKSTTYTKTQVDNALALKANSADLATVATTGDYDDLINKPVIPDAQVQSDYAQSDNTKVDYIKNKPDIDAMIAAALLAVMPIDTASGPIASFDTELAVPLVNVSCNVLATGGYDADTQTAHPINGYTEANITRCGVNLFDKTTFTDDYSNTYEIDTDGSIKQIRTPNVNDILWSNITKKSGSFTLTFKVKYSVGVGVGVRPKIIYTDGSSETVSPTNTQDYTEYVKTTNVSKTVDKITTDYGSSAIMTNFYFQVENASQASALTDYTGNTYTIAFGQTVYGGVLDVTRGKLTVTHAFETFTISEYSDKTVLGSYTRYRYNLANSVKDNDSNQLCNLADYNANYSSDTLHFYCANTTAYRAFAFLPNGIDESRTVEFCYPLETPFDIDLTPEVISAVVGTNNVYSDTNGDTTVQFKDSIQHYIDKKVGS